MTHSCWSARRLPGTFTVPLSLLQLAVVKHRRLRVMVVVVVAAEEGEMEGLAARWIRMGLGPGKVRRLGQVKEGMAMSDTDNSLTDWIPGDVCSRTPR